MLKLDLDWAADEAPATQENGVMVAYDEKPGPSGWPTVVVVAIDGPTLWSWLVDVYGCDGDMASELASLAEDVTA